jgi:hypothetical protein
MYKNIQTTSTKCQYQSAASNPKWWFDAKCSVVLYVEVDEQLVHALCAGWRAM